VVAGAVGRSWKRRTRQCAVCRKHFVPHPRVGERQLTCGGAECRREQHRRTCARWRAAHGDDDRADRLRERLRAQPNESAGTVVEGDPPQVAWSVAREVVGPQVSVIIEESHQVLVRWLREQIRSEVVEIK
jgi:hypothetical protein